MSHIRTSLAKHVPYTPMNDDDLRRQAARLYHQTGTVMIRPEWITNDLDRQHMKNLAEKLYGRRSG